MLVELLTGRLPLDDAPEDIYMTYLERHGFPRPYDRPPGPRVPDALRPVVERATANEPSERFESAREFAVELGWACQRGGIEFAPARPLAAPPLPAAPPPPAARRLTPALHGTLGAALGAASTLALFGAWEAPPVLVTAEARALGPERPAAAVPHEAVSTYEAVTAPEAVDAPEVVAAPEAPAVKAPPRAAASASDAKTDRRARLEAKLRGGKGDVADAFALKRLCFEAGDKACLQRANDFIHGLSSGR
ncbi:MAG TPA: hypothetical protein VFS43_30780 [Polyangiaceae bacterium]|nr:hypothetical protein [Polyangiaceae bacterium]